jgi:hypothetical protein
MSTELLITSVLTKHDEQKTTINVTILEEVAPGLKNETGRYVVELDTLYTDTADPGLMAAIAEKLALLPE